MFVKQYIFIYIFYLFTVKQIFYANVNSADSAAVLPIIRGRWFIIISTI